MLFGEQIGNILAIFEFIIMLSSVSHVHQEMYEKLGGSAVCQFAQDVCLWESERLIVLLLVAMDFVNILEWFDIIWLGIKFSIIT